MKNLLKLTLMTLVVGCGAAVDPEEVQPESLATQESALIIQCGQTCPSGYYISERRCDVSCGSCSTSPNQVVCETIPSSGTINPCGSTCPAGFTNQGTLCNGVCWTCFSPSFTNSVICSK